jgi:hypothetical protein
MWRLSRAIVPSYDISATAGGNTALKSQDCVEGLSPLCGT